MKNKQAGFTLVEIALVLAIIGILTSGAIYGFKAQRDTAKFAESNSRLEQIKQALLTFTVVNGHLPCPDSFLDGDYNGEEDINGDACKANHGQIPYSDLGLTKSAVSDSWGSAIYYAIDRGATNATNFDATAPPNTARYFDHTDSNPTFNLKTPPDQTTSLGNLLRVCNTTNCDEATSASEVFADKLSAVLVAYNSNGLATWSACSNAKTDEKKNCNHDNFFIQLTPSESFDDSLITISAYEIKATFLKNNPTALQ